MIGFFMYKRTTEQADTATICRFMIDRKFQNKGLGREALQHILRGLKIQGVRKVLIMLDDTNEIAEKLYLSFD